MIFFGKDIINQIIDSTEIEELTEKVEQFKNDVNMIFTYFSYPKIDIDYVQNLLEYKTNQTAFYCMDTEFNIRSCPSCMIYSKQNKKNSDTIYYYIMMICTQRRFKNLGYASMLLDGFVEKVREDTKDEPKTVKIVLSSVDEVVSYYQRYGFEVVDYTLESHPYLMRFEKCDSDKMYTVMELNISTHASPF
jgi:ribosomal protein S18 acetylase RimI-like enzyme